MDQTTTSSPDPWLPLCFQPAISMTGDQQNEIEAGKGCTLILYDGVCGLCNRLVNFLLHHDRRNRFRFAALQSPFARTLQQKHGLSPDTLDTIVVLADYLGPTESALMRSDAVLFAFHELGGIWRFSIVAKFLPLIFREWIYKLISGRRYRIFGKYDECPVPCAADRHKFII